MCYLYGVSSRAARLVNVRLDEERLRKVRRLRESGVALSDVVREAIDERFSALRERGKSRDVRAVMTRILGQSPDPPDLPRRTYDIHDGKAARAAILQKLGRKRR